MFYEKEIELVAHMHKKISTQITDGSEWDIVVSKHLVSILPRVRKELHNAFLNTSNYAKSSSGNFSVLVDKSVPSYLKPYLKESEIRLQWQKFNQFDKTAFKYPESLEAVNSLKTIYFLSLCYIFLYLRTDADVSNLSTATQSQGLSPVQANLYKNFYDALQTFEQGGELYEALKNSTEKAKNLDPQMSFNDLEFFNTVAARLAFAFKTYIEK